jgi:hypothetical protein
MRHPLVEGDSVSITPLFVERRVTERTSSMDTRLPTHYQITIKGHLDSHWASWFDGMTIANEPAGTAVLTGRITDQAALHGLLAKIRDLGLPLVAVQPIAPDSPPR